jgi:FkbM family methyltransferase
MMNLALGRPALQSSTSPWSTSPIVGEDASRANNGDLKSKQIFHTARQLQPWWQVDLGEDFVLEEVRIFNWRPTAERLVNFSLLCSRDGKSWRNVFRKKDDIVFGRQNEQPYVCRLTNRALSRFLRVRLDGTNYLSFRECEVLGRKPAEEEILELEKREMDEERGRLTVPEGRKGQVIVFGDHHVFVDPERYGEPLVRALKGGYYEAREREVVDVGLRFGDRVLEAGSAIGVVTMSAAAIVGAENILSFEANPTIIADARNNFERNSLQSISLRNGLLKPASQITAPDETVEFHISKDFVSSRMGNVSGARDIVKTVKVPVYCLEEEIRDYKANVLLLDIEGGEVELLLNADLTGIRAIMMETHYGLVGETSTDIMMRKLIQEGFNIHLGSSGANVVLLRR